MAMKYCTKLETAKERCPIVFQGHPSNFKVTRDKTSPILTQIGRFRTIGQSQLSNPSDLPCLTHCDLVAPHDICWQKSGATLAQAIEWIPGGTKAITEPMFTYHQWVAFTWEQFDINWSWYQFPIWVWKLHFCNYCHVCPGPMSSLHDITLMGSEAIERSWT